eukprot:TRINITY_DN2820_c0_g1_i1.p1 TRINITY_DN2820_c0_g1~~TRINITY_DN2820_c0_g1_i1.p1  ORF type:complete len:471 (-),score=92.95 TRINITY_DN2820_c0_g1_i1:92-1504(-)
MPIQLAEYCGSPLEKMPVEVTKPHCLMQFEYMWDDGNVDEGVLKELKDLKRAKCDNIDCAMLRYSPFNYCTKYHSDADRIRDFPYDPDLHYVKETGGEDYEGPRNYYEKAFHPFFYKTVRCKHGEQCKYVVCAGYHHEQERRVTEQSIKWEMMKLSKSSRGQEIKSSSSELNLKIGERPTQVGESFKEAFSSSRALERWCSGRFGHFFLFSVASLKGNEHHAMFEKLVKILPKEKTRPWTRDLLLNYLSHTVQRLLETNKIVFNDDCSQALGNTGLVDRSGEPLLFNFKGIHDHDRRPILTRICPAKNMPDSFEGVVPEPAEYFSVENMRDCSLEWDNRVWFDVRENLRHIIDRFVERSMDDLKIEESELIIEVVKKLTSLAKDMMTTNSPSRNKAVPAFYREEGHAGPGHLNMFLPFRLREHTLALAVQIVKVKGKVVKYKAATLMTIDQAYPMARLLGPVDAEWMNDS